MSRTHARLALRAALVAAAALAIVAPAFAQPPGGGPGAPQGRGPQGQAQGAQGQGAHGARGPGAHGQGAQGPAVRGPVANPAGPTPNVQQGQGAGQGRYGHGTGQGHVGGQVQGGGGAGLGGLPVYPGYRGADVHSGEGYRGDRNDFGGVFRAPRRYHAAPYVRPQGWYEHRWGYGDTLPQLFWGRDYWILDYWLYALSPPPYGYVWVRYGSDALLIDNRTGQVVEVVYGAFY